VPVSDRGKGIVDDPAALRGVGGQRWANAQCHLDCLRFVLAQPGPFCDIGHDNTGGGGETPGGKSFGVSFPAGPRWRI
jgi:hypothetical protein